MTDNLPPDDGKNEPGKPPASGQRKDGKPFKENNTRDDGSYDMGKFRPPAEHQFRPGDGRKRGKRMKGSKNVSAIWAKKLKQKFKFDGKEQTAAEWLVEGMIRRGITRSDRAAETALGEAGRLETERERLLGKTDDEIIEAWLGQRLSEAANEISDDHGSHDTDGDNGANPQGGEASHEDQ